jgi:hypothetical protein
MTEAVNMKKSVKIARIDYPTEDLFRREYLKRGIPVVITKSDKNPRQFDWDFDYLTDVVGETKVNVYDWGDRGPSVDDDFKIIKMQLAKALELCRGVSSTEDQRYALCQLPIEQLGDLIKHYQLPAYLENSDHLDKLPRVLSEQRRIALFISFFRGMHWHNGRHAIAQQITGSKKFYLFDPKESDCLYPKGFWQSPISWFDQTEAVFCSEVPFEDGLSNIDFSKYPKLKNVTPYEVELQAGETLFIPSHWWHYTNANEPCVLITHFWDAAISEWGFPIAKRSFLMKPYRKYLYRSLMNKKGFTRQAKSV